MVRHLRALGLAAFAFGIVLSPQHAKAATDETKLQCIEANEQAQVMRRDGHLRSARKNLLTCTRSGCPLVIQKECGAWLEQVNAEQPTVVFSVRDEHGSDVTTVRVFSDGEPLVEHLDGRPTEVDPGEHTFRFDLGNGKTMERHLLLREGEKDRLVEISLASAPATALPPTASTSSSPEADASSSANTTVGVVVGVVGLAALGGAVAFTILQNNNASNAHAACSAGCTLGSAGATQAESDVSSAKTQRVVAGVSFGIAGVAIGVASYFFFARPLKGSSETPTSPSAGFMFDASPQGAWAGYRASF